jgi:hypothetical protein
MHPVIRRLAVRAALYTIVLLSAGLLTLSAFAKDERECASWNNPGQNRFTGSTLMAIWSYKHIDLTTRVALQARVLFTPPDFITEITKRGIMSSGTSVFVTDVQGMHFGRGSKAACVSRVDWPENHTEATRVWCVKANCVGSPYVCNNIFSAERRIEAVPQFEVAPDLAMRTVNEPDGLLLSFAAVAAACGVGCGLRR